jgi:hypothetical protein
VTQFHIQEEWSLKLFVAQIVKILPVFRGICSFIYVATPPATICCSEESVVGTGVTDFQLLESCPTVQSEV